MVASPKSEHSRFKDALNARVAKDHSAERGRPRWLLARLKEEYRKKTGRRSNPVSYQTCAYWLAGKKLPKPEHIPLLLDALGMSRGELFGEGTDPRLEHVIETWKGLSEDEKTRLFLFFGGKLIGPEKAA